MKNLKISIIVFATFLTSCNETKTNNNCGKWVVKNGTSKWEYGVINSIDSITMHNSKHVTVHINGTSQEVYADWIVTARHSDCN